MKAKKDLIAIFPARFRERLEDTSWEGLEEIRLRMGLPIELIYGDRSVWLGSFLEAADKSMLEEMLNYITDYSSYALAEELRQGYLTYKGGHRIGVVGHTTYEHASSGEKSVSALVDIGGFNVRIAHERKDCAKEIVPYIRNKESIYNTLFFAAPGVGKTTYLRDTIRLLSDGDEAHPGLKVSVIDERSEIAACVMGKPQKDLGKRTDVLDACPKAVGMSMVLRSMSPQLIAVDELGSREEYLLLEQMRCSGVKLLGTIHAGSMEELLSNPFIRENIKTGGLERFVELLRGKDGVRSFRIYGAKGDLLWESHWSV